MILRIAERIEDPEVDEDELQEWRECCLRCTAIIEMQKTVEDRYWRSINLREATVADFCDDGWGSGLGFCSDSLPKACEWRDKYHHYFDKGPVLPGIIYY